MNKRRKCARTTRRGRCHDIWDNLLAIKERSGRIPERRVREGARDPQHPVRLDDTVRGMRVLQRDHGQLRNFRRTLEC